MTDPTDDDTPQEPEAQPPSREVERETLPEFGGYDGGELVPDDGEFEGAASSLEAVYDVPVQVSAVLGKARIDVSQLVKLGRGALIELDRKVGEAIDVYVNNRLVARGEVVLVEEKLGVTMTEIIRDE